MKYENTLTSIVLRTFGILICATLRVSTCYILHTYPPMKMGQCSETSAYKIQTPENYPEESIEHSEHCEKVEIKNTY
jgi:hypothetical protein